MQRGGGKRQRDRHGRVLSRLRKQPGDDAQHGRELHDTGRRVRPRAQHRQRRHRRRVRWPPRSPPRRRLRPGVLGALSKTDSLDHNTRRPSASGVRKGDSSVILRAHEGFGVSGGFWLLFVLLLLRFSRFSSVFFERTTLDECVSIDIAEKIQNYVPGRL